MIFIKLFLMAFVMAVHSEVPVDEAPLTPGVTNLIAVARYQFGKIEQTSQEAFIIEELRTVGFVSKAYWESGDRIPESEIAAHASRLKQINGTFEAEAYSVASIWEGLGALMYWSLDMADATQADGEHSKRLGAKSPISVYASAEAVAQWNELSAPKRKLAELKRGKSVNSERLEALHRLDQLLLSQPEMDRAIRELFEKMIIRLHRAPRTLGY